MQLNFTGRHNLEITPALKSAAEEKFQLISRHHSNIQKINLVFHVENIDQIAEATVHIDGIEVHATAQAQDMYAALDELVHKLSRQLAKHKEKHTDHR